MVDISLLIYWQQDRPNLIEGSIIECQLIRHATWNGSEYIPSEPVHHPKVVRIFVTGVPATDINIVKAILEEYGDSNLREWSAKRNSLHPVDEGAPLISNKYITLTWTRFKEVVENLDEEPLQDSWFLNWDYFANQIP